MPARSGVGGQPPRLEPARDSPVGNAADPDLPCLTWTGAAEAGTR
jgi:hypothetical protein